MCVCLQRETACQSERRALWRRGRGCVSEKRRPRLSLCSPLQRLRARETQRGGEAAAVRIKIGATKAQPEAIASEASLQSDGGSAMCAVRVRPRSSHLNEPAAEREIVRERERVKVELERKRFSPLSLSPSFCLPLSLPLSA